MGTITSLRKFLKSLCSNLNWKYAVFWKLKHHSETILTWEDGYCECLPRKAMESSMDYIYPGFRNNSFSSHYETSIQNGSSERDPIKLILDDMSRIQYALGEGLVGRVASTGNHSWVSLNDIFSSEADSNATIRSPDEWILQFASGIKTILAVPVIPHGVLVLGSLEMILEDLAVAAYVRDRFNALHYISRNTSFSEKLEEFSAIEDLKMELSNLNSFMPLSTVQNALPESGKDLYPPSNQYTNGTPLEMTERKLFGSSSHWEELSSHDLEMFEGNLNGLRSYSSGFMEELLFGHYNATEKGDKSMDGFLTFPEDCELHKALGPAFQIHPEESLTELSFSTKDTSSSMVCNKDQTDKINPSWPTTEENADYLLDAVVANLYSSSDYTSSNKCSNSRSTPSSEKFSASQLHSRSEVSTLIGSDSAPLSCAKRAVHSRSRDTLTSSLTSTSFGSMLSSLIINEEKGYSTKPRKALNSSNAGRRKARNGDHQRPRPRDRQLIQDRVKELRELVPNGSKCSVDGLLDQTIKHMVYLRNVTDQAEKLKQLAYQEIGDRMNWMSIETEEGWQNGASRAFNLDSELQVCPIVVEDLEYPGHILIKMLCNDEGLFLEIAEVVRRLDLTIMKGVMECRLNNTWARFIVEASSGFQRMDIFWPLMQLLQRKRNPISCRI